jgi:hypothetical protein
MNEWIEVTIEEVASQYRHSSIEETIQVYKDLWILPDNYDFKMYNKNQDLQKKVF